MKEIKWKEMMGLDFREMRQEWKMRLKRMEFPKILFNWL